MTRTLRSAFLSLFAVGMAASLSGCKVDCEPGDDSVQCIGQSTVQYIGTPIVRQVAWTDGQRLTVGIVGGNIRTGETASTSITINPHSTGGKPAECSDATQVCVRFLPINNDTKDRKDEATRQMKQVAEGGNLLTNVGSDANGVVVTVDLDNRNGKYNSSLSAIADIWIPDNFNGDIVAKSESGGISVRGARRGATVETGLGDIAFDLVSVIPTTTDNTITTRNGDIIFSVPRSANLNIQGQVSGAGDKVLIDTVTGWQEVEGSTEQSATFCGNAACSGQSEGLWKLNATSLGSIQIKLLLA
ncbi:MAG: hypothetical protein RMJ98_21675 [Myxococcales bacterium]|nr:hypothetical protein [Polyangiaceae bacterium]MDW8251914.1 hypothetical protein [Myxococcales bacterium]